jgi:hypothetical protein
MRINSLEEVRPGDIMLAGQSSAPSKILVYGGEFIMGESFRIGKFVSGHAAVVVPGNRLVEAMPHGARIRDITADDWTPAQIFFRLPEDYPGQALDAAAVAMAMIDTPYSIMSYAYLAGWRFGLKSEWLKTRINRRRPATTFTLPSGRVTTNNLPMESICSVLAEQSWTLTGKEVIHGTVPQVVTPGMLGEQLWCRDGVIVGGAGLL